MSERETNTWRRKRMKRREGLYFFLLSRSERERSKIQE
jgi:hypothetical protein